MRTVKLVIIGNSGVGKTSFRGQYVSGHFSTGYRSTIGTDFITKTLPHHSNPEESVTLQIWDTAGQERFSSLSSALFRGADAAILIFDVNQPETLRALHRWWSEFCACAPLSDEEMEDYCLVVVGNKTDLVPNSEEGAVSEVTASQFIDELVPPSESSGSLSSSPVTPADEGEGAWIPSHAPLRVSSGSDDNDDDGNLDSGTTDSEDIICVDETRPPVVHLTTPDADHAIGVADEEDSTTPTVMIPPRTPSIDLHAHHPKHSFQSHSRFSLTPSVTVSSIQTDFASFHTPASSFSDGLEPYQSAVSSPLSHSRSPSSSPPLYARRTYRSLSTSTVSTSTALTITPARYAAVHQSTHRTVPSRPPRGPKLFFTSAKTGAGVSDVFDYVARRVVMRWEWEEAHVGSPTLVGNPSTVHLGGATTGKKRTFRPACCSS